MLAITYPNGNGEQFQYDPLGQLTESINGRGDAIDYIYNSAGLLTRKTYADGTHVDYTYDSHQNLISATDSTGTTTMAYDSADRLTKITYPSGRFPRIHLRCRRTPHPERRPGRLHGQLRL